jgi:hypothetical protein
MLSIGDMVDKLCIESIKIFNIREKIHDQKTTDEEKITLTETMIALNENRGIIMNYLDDKINNVVNNGEPNVVLKKIKTYNLKK